MSLDTEDKQWIEAILGRQIAAMETRLLTAFHSCASPIEARQRSHSAAIRAIDAETEYRSNQLAEIEAQVRRLADRVTRLEAPPS